MAMRYSLGLLLLPTLLVACGGGGSGTESDASIPQEAQEVGAVLESCAAEGIDRTLGLLDSLLPTGGTPNLTLSGLQGAVIPFFSDLDGDEQPDLTGILSFVDSDGAPLTPFTEEEISGGIEMLLPLLSRLSDGDRMLIQVDPTAEIESAWFAMRFMGGLPLTVSAAASTIVDACLVTLDFEDVSTLSLLGDVPNLAANLRILDGNNEILGKVRLDGSDSARIDAARNGGTSYEYLLDLVSGALTY